MGRGCWRMSRWSQEHGGTRASFGSLGKQYHCRCPVAVDGALSGDLGRQLFCFSHFMRRKAAPHLSTSPHCLDIHTISGIYIYVWKNTGQWGPCYAAYRGEKIDILTPLKFSAGVCRGRCALRKCYIWMRGKDSWGGLGEEVRACNRSGRKEVALSTWENGSRNRYLPWSGGSLTKGTFPSSKGRLGTNVQVCVDV